MRYTDEITKSAKLCAVIILLTGLIFALLSFVFPKAAFVFPLLFALIAAPVVFGFLQGFRKQIEKPIETLDKHIGILTGNPKKTVPELKDAPAEFTAMNEKLRTLSGSVKNIITDVNEQKEILADESKYDLQVIREVTEAAFDNRELNVKIGDILRTTLDYCNIEACYIFFRDENGSSFVRKNYYDDEAGTFDYFIPAENQYRLFARILNSSIPEYILNLPSNENLPAHIRDWAEKNKIINLYCIPIHSGDVPFGVVMLAMPETREFERGQSILLHLVADIIGNFFREEMRLNESMGLYSAVEAENSIYSAFYKTKNFEEACGEIVRTVSQIFPMDWGAVYYYDRKREYVKFTALSLKDPLAEPKLTVIPYSDSAVEWVEKNHKSWMEEDLSLMKPFTEDSMYLKDKLVSRVVVPIYFEGSLIGAMAASSQAKSSFDEEYVINLESVTPVVGAVVQTAFLRDAACKTDEKSQKTGCEHEKFFNMLAHELRNPLNLLHRISHTVREKGSGLTPDQVKEAFQVVSMHTLALYKSIEDVLDYSRAEAGRIDFFPADFYIYEALKEVMWECSDDAKEKGINLKWEFAKGMPEVTADSEKLVTIIREITGNALKHTPSGGTVTVKANVFPTKWLKEKAGDFFPKHILENMDLDVNQLLFSVTDSGSGISAEKQKIVFKTPAEAPEKLSSGTGRLKMGLPRIKKLVESHHGFIWLSSREGAGTRVSFNIPQYGKDWATLRNIIDERLYQAKQSLYCISAIAIAISQKRLVKNSIGETQFRELMRDIEKIVKPAMREQDDVVLRHYDNEHIIVVGKADFEQVQLIKNRLVKVLSYVNTSSIPVSVSFEFPSVTYPDEALTADDFITKLNARIEIAEK
ncbi:MAG: ATP-binding protein [Firmicutes bacterium]|nr:ATP-binding protein [Bacillota bacterium]